MSQSALAFAPEASASSGEFSTFNFNSNAIRVVVRNGEPWFVAADICKALGYLNTSKAVADHLDEDERYNESLDRGGNLTIISESGMYTLVLRSHKPSARKFAKWVTSEVLPAIRKTGGYGKTDPEASRAAVAEIARQKQQAMQGAMATAIHLLGEFISAVSYADAPLQQRFMTYFDQMGAPSVIRLPADVHVCTVKTMAKRISDGDEVFSDAAELLAISTACIKRLRSDHPAFFATMFAQPSSGAQLHQSRQVCTIGAVGRQD